ncbi:MAG: hypothetical protein VX879_03740 [Pseudomonadota bacterium]|nr:hypothetical protein [Pseudomonadota bacterium]
MEYKRYSRKQIVEEELLRENIRKVIKESLSQRKAQKLIEKDEKFALRSLIKELILEAEADIAPHESTGINVLEDLLKKIVPQIEGDFKTLTTDKAQRDSFRAHILKATENTIAPKSAMYNDGEATQPEEEELELEGEELMEPETEDGAPDGSLGAAAPAPEVDPLEEIEVNINSEDPEEVDAGDITSLDDDEKLIDIDNNLAGGSDPDEAFEEIAGEDATGRNIANMSFQKIEKSIQDSYGLLGDTKDQDLFRDYLLTNLKLYFDKFEDEIDPASPEEPTTPEYEEEKGKAAEGETGEENLGDEEEELELDV